MRLKSWERRDILALHAAGYTQKRIAELTMRSPDTVQLVLANERLEQVEKDRDEVRGFFKLAAGVAAARGDHKPALEWLDRYGQIPETSAQRLATERTRISARAMRYQIDTSVTSGGGRGSGPVVNIGLAFPPGMSPKVDTGTVIEGFLPPKLSDHTDSIAESTPRLMQVSELDPRPLAGLAKGPHDDEPGGLAPQLETQPAAQSLRQSPRGSDRASSRRAK